MITVPNEIFAYLAKKFSFEPGTLAKIGGGREDSDGHAGLVENKAKTFRNMEAANNRSASCYRAGM